jgi:hypothetical protein
MYTVRVEELKNFCDFAGNNYAKLLEHGNTMFLSWGPSIDRILSMFDGLRIFFLKKNTLSCCRNCLKIPVKLWL